MTTSTSSRSCLLEDRRRRRRSLLNSRPSFRSPMMAVESKQSSPGIPAPASGATPASTLAGVQVTNGKPRRKRPSSLMAQAAQLPSVENSLDDFIARANETLVDPASFNTEKVRAAEDEKRKEADALRWKAAEQ